MTDNSQEPLKIQPTGLFITLQLRRSEDVNNPKLIVENCETVRLKGPYNLILYPPVQIYFGIRQ